MSFQNQVPSDSSGMGHCHTDVPRDPFWIGTLIVAFVALILRLWNLGTFSLWLDEVFTMKFASLPFARLLDACAHDAENVPLYAIITHLSGRAGLEEPWIRLPFILMSTLGIVLLMVWIRQRLGSTAAITAGVFSALSPFHIRYSQELRAYPILLLLIPSCLLLGEGLRRRPNWVSATAMAVLVTLGAYSHLSFWLIVPVLLVIVTGENGNLRSRPTRLTFAAIGAGLVAFGPWMAAIWKGLGTRLDRGGTDWTLAEIGIRWHALTVASREGVSPTVISVILGIAFIAGLILLLRDRGQRWMTVAFIGTWAAWEGVLALVGHWSDARYNLALWIIIPLAFGMLSEWLLTKTRIRWIRLLMWGSLVVLIGPGTWAYWHQGRPHWDLIAGAIRSIAHRNEAVIAANDWTQLCLSWYLPRGFLRPPSDLADTNYPSALVATGGYGASLLKTAPPFDLRIRLFKIPGTARVDCLVHSHTGDQGQPSWWPPMNAPPPKSLIIPPLPIPERWFRSFFAREPTPQSGLSLDFGDPLGLSAVGIGPPRHDPRGKGYAWAIGQEAAIALPALNGRTLDIQLSLRPFVGVEDSQWIRLLINGRTALKQQLKPGLQTLHVIDFPFDGKTTRPILTLQFSNTARPSELRNNSADTRPLAAALSTLVVHAH